MVLAPHVISSTSSGDYLHIEVWEDDGSWPDDHYGDVDITTSSNYDAHGSAYPRIIMGDWRCGYYNPNMGNFPLPSRRTVLVEGIELQYLARLSVLPLGAR